MISLLTAFSHAAGSSIAARSTAATDEVEYHVVYATVSLLFAGCAAIALYALS